jgi:hypothetical protein
MDKPSKKEENFTKKIIKEAGLSAPSIDFTNQVMAIVTARKVVQKAYQPLISKRAWGIVTIAISLVLLLILTIPFENESYFSALKLQERLQFSLPQWELSKTLTYAIGFMALFLLQIPFLKHYLGKQYR